MTGKKKFLTLATILIASVSLGVGVVAINSVSQQQQFSVAKSDPTEYTITLDSTNTASSLSNSYQGSVAGTVITKGDYTLALKYLTAKKADGAHVMLCSRSKLYNEPNGSDYNNRITGLRSITVNFTTAEGGKLFLKTSIRNDGLEYGPRQEVTSGVPIALDDLPYYFMLETEDKPVTITSIILKYSCSTNAGLYLDQLKGTYTGDNGTVGLKLVIDGNNSRIDSIGTDAVSYTNLVPTLNGNTLTLSNGTVTFTATVSADHTTLTSTALNATLRKVYNVEDFESYASTGAGYDNNGHKSWYDVTGLRSQFYAQYANNDSSYALMGNTDWVTLTPAGMGHANGKAMLIKVSYQNYMRYMQTKVYYGDTSLAGKGSKLSFWAAGALTSNTSTTQSQKDVVVDVYGFHKISGRIKDNADIANAAYHTVGTVTVPHESDWSHYEINLDPTKNYSGFAFKTRIISGSANAYLPVDDVEIYSTSPYEAFVPSTPVSGVAITEDSAYVEQGKTRPLTATVSPANATNKNVTWTSSNDAVAAVDENGVVTGVAPGNAVITVTTEDGDFTDTCNVTVEAPYTYLSGLYVGKANLSMSGIDGEFPVMISSGDQRFIEFAFCGVVAKSYGYRVVSATNTFTIHSDVEAEVPLQAGLKTYYLKVVVKTMSGVIQDGTFKNITFGDDCTICYKEGKDGTYSAETSLASVTTNNGSINFTKQVNDANTLEYGCEGSTEEMQAMFTRRWRAWGSQNWTVDNDSSHTDRVKKDTTSFMDGTSGMSLRGYSSGESTLSLTNDLNGGEGTDAYNNISFWVCYHGTAAKQLSVYVFTEAGYAGAKQITTPVMQPGQWQFVTCGFKEKVYNFQLFVSGSPQYAFTIDNLCLYKS